MYFNLCSNLSSRWLQTSDKQIQSHEHRHAQRQKHRHTDEIRSTSLQHVSIYKDSSDGAESPVRRAGRRVGEIHSLTTCVRVCQCVWLSSDLGQGTTTWIKGGGRVTTTDVTDVKGNEEQPINRLLLLNNKPLVKNLGLELKKKSLKT